MAHRSMKIALLSRNAKLYSSRRLIEAAKARGHSVQVVDVLRCYMKIAPNCTEIHYRGKKLEGFDAVSKGTIEMNCANAYFWAGKTFAGAWWINHLAEIKDRRFALVGPTLHDVREVMVEGPSGLKALPERAKRPRWEAGRRRLVWPNGSEAHAFSAEDPDSLRGPQFHHGWADEFCAWRRPELVLGNLRLGLRLGDDPRLVVTTTPRPIPALRRLLGETRVGVDRAGTQANAGHLSPGFLAHLRALYAGTRLEAQELEGLMVEAEGALFRAEDLARARGHRPASLEQIVVAVDPPASAGGDACGIVVVGRRDRCAYVLADRSRGGESPQGWATIVAQTARAFGAREIVAEKNQGGEMVEHTLRTVRRQGSMQAVHATRGKATRAEPVAARYEPGRVHHVGVLGDLEGQMTVFPVAAEHDDLVDALVWAVTGLVGGKDRTLWGFS